jgi:membrane fusion protein (multidrug efflux system)
MKRLNLAIVTLLFFGCSQPQAPVATPPALPVVTVAQETIATYQEYPASIEGAVNVEIRPQVTGLLEHTFVDEGAYVRAGQALFKIDERPFKAALSNATASYRAAQGALLNADLEVEKLTPLVQNKVVSDYQLKTARAAFSIAKANMEQAKALISTAEINLGYALIKAPVSGFIGRLIKKQGSLVGPTDAESLTELSDVHDVHVYFSLAEKDFVAFKELYPGKTLLDKIRNLPAVTLLLSDNTQYTLPGRVDIVDGQFDKNTGAITFRASFPNPDGLIRSGNTGKLRLKLLHANAMVIPESATFESQDKVFVFVLADSNKVKKVPVTIAGKNESNFLISNGLKPDDRIVLSGFESLKEGTKIDPQPNTEAVATVKN